METKHTDTGESAREFYGCLEAYAREHLQAWLQDLLEQEVMEVLGHHKHERKIPGGEQAEIAMSMGSPGGLRSVWGQWKPAGRGCGT